MVVHKCNVCFKEFSKKSHYDQHKNKKFSCKPNTQNYTEIPQNKTDIPKNYTENTQNHTKNTENGFDNNKNNCKYCLKKFSRSDSLNRHLQTCKIIKLENEKKQNIYNNLVENDILKKQMEEIIENNNKMTEMFKKQNEELKKQNEELNNKMIEILKKNTQNIVNNTNNTQNIVNNINITPVKLNPFGKENLKTIKHDDFIKIITDTSNTGRFCFNRLVDLIHFNNKLPENQNIYMPDYNRGKFMYYNGEQWKLTQDDENIIFQVLEHVRSLFNINNNEELEEKLEKDKKFCAKFNTTFKKYYDWIYDETDDMFMNKQELKKKNDFKALISREIVNNLYNNREKVKKNYEKLESSGLIKTCELLKLK
jgi:hypothetical protein